MNTKYNGWTNYETWCVHVWLSNSPEPQTYFAIAAQLHLELASQNEPGSGATTVRELARTRLAKQLREEIEERNPLSEASLFLDLIEHSLAIVEWDEIAANMLEGLPVPYCDAHSVPVQTPKPAVPTGIEPRFPLGRMVATPQALAVTTDEERARAMTRHERGDWGLVPEEDRKTNERAVRDGLRLLSAYETAAGVKFWIITEADRSVTTLLLPDDY